MSADDDRKHRDAIARMRKRLIDSGTPPREAERKAIEISERSRRKQGQP